VAPLALVHGTLVCRGTPVGNHCSRPGMHNSNLMAGQLICFETLRAETTMLLTCSIGVSFKQTSKKQENLCFAGHIKSFRGPYVVHACSKQ